MGQLQGAGSQWTVSGCGRVGGGSGGRKAQLLQRHQGQGQAWQAGCNVRQLAAQHAPSPAPAPPPTLNPATRPRPGMTHCEFEQSDHLGDAPLDDPSAPYDAVTLMFAMHYFFERPEMLRQLLANVAANLRVGELPPKGGGGGGGAD